MEYLVVNVDEMRGKMSEVIKAVYRNHQDKVLLLYYVQNSTAPVITMEDVKTLFELRLAPRYIPCTGSEDDTVMEIASDIGYLIGITENSPEHTHDTYIIVSNNSSYNRLASFWRDAKNISIKIMPLASLLCCTMDTDPAINKPTENVDMIPKDPWLDDAERRLITGY